MSCLKYFVFCFAFFRSLGFVRRANFNMNYIRFLMRVICFAAFLFMEWILWIFFCGLTSFTLCLVFYLRAIFIICVRLSFALVSVCLIVIHNTLDMLWMQSNNNNIDDKEKRRKPVQLPFRLSSSSYSTLCTYRNIRNKYHSFTIDVNIITTTLSLQSRMRKRQNERKTKSYTVCISICQPTFGRYEKQTKNKNDRHNNQCHCHIDILPLKRHTRHKWLWKI